ncbi:MAG: PBP1A family penicillin-binding protein [Candidatus Moranbacteria bacterium]|nr:PBP1A family penicillin-binding protein [Candidatus Moranbacteria bacterium]
MKNSEPVNGTRRPYRRIAIEVASVVVLALFALALSLVGVFLFGTPDPRTLPELSLAQTSCLYDRTGTHELYCLHGEENRKVLVHGDIPDVVRRATVAAEDESFYRHHGIDAAGTVRALLVNLKAGKIEQGGSTITQQLARNAYYTRERTVKRKLLESLMALKIELFFSKDEILDMYLNRVPYGANAYGIAAAAETYFGKPAADLTPDEAALLASLTKAPSAYSPYVASKGTSLSQRDTVLSRMAEAGYLTEEDLKAAKSADTVSKVRPFLQPIQAPHFVFYILEGLEKTYGRDALEAGGWKILTTLDWEKQRLAEQSVREGVVRNRSANASNAALTAIDPKTGEVLAMVGSRDFHDTSIDGEVNVALRPRQPGSSFKPIVYAAAFEKGFQPETLLVDKPIDFGPDGTGKEYVPQNYDGQFRGVLSMRETLAQSLNVPAVETLYLAGIGRTIDFARRLGITTLGNPDRYGLALVLGGGEVRLLDMVTAFGVFAREGVRAETHGVLRIIGPDGARVDADGPAPASVLDPEVARKVASIMSDDSARAPVFGARGPLTLPDRPVAAKTGTTQDFHDAWTVGYTPSLVAGVWVGNNDNAPMKAGSDGVYVAAPIWHAFMAAATSGAPVEAFTPYSKVESDKLLLTGLRDESAIEYFDLHSGKKLSPEKAAKKDPSRVRVSYGDGGKCILSYVNKDDPLGPTPPDLSDPMIPRWEAPAPEEQATKP